MFNEHQIVTNQDFPQDTKIILNKRKYKAKKEGLCIKIFRLIINAILSLILIGVAIYALATYNPQWRLFYFLASWSYFMILIYIINVTLIDLFAIAFKIYLNSYNDFIRNYYIRICTPFSIATFFVYWELVLLGNSFQKRGDDINDYCEAVFLNGIVLLFLFFDFFASPHIYRQNRCSDIVILTIIILFYYALVCLGKYLEVFEPYNFMRIADVRQISATGIIVYVLVLNGYIVYDLLASYLFENENHINILDKQILIEKNDMSSRQIFNYKNSDIIASNTIEINDVENHLKKINLSNNLKDNNIYDNNNRKIYDNYKKENRIFHNKNI
jgi:hypothetical protein